MTKFRTFNIEKGKGTKIIAPETAFFNYTKTNHILEHNSYISRDMLTPGDIIKNKEGEVVFAGCDEKGSIHILPYGCSIVSVDEFAKEFVMEDENGKQSTESYFDNAVFVREKPEKSTLRKVGEVLGVGVLAGALIAGGLGTAIEMHEKDYTREVPQTYAIDTTIVENAHGRGILDGATITLDPTHAELTGETVTNHVLDLGNVSLSGRATQISVTPYSYPDGSSAGEVRTFTNESGEVQASGQIIDRENGIFSGQINGEQVTGRLSSVDFEYNTTGTSVQRGTMTTETPVLKAGQLGVDMLIVGGALVGGALVGKKGTEYMVKGGKTHSEADREIMKLLKALETNTAMPDGIMIRRDAQDLISLQIANEKIYRDLIKTIENPQNYDSLKNDLARFYTLADDLEKLYTTREKNEDLSERTRKLAADIKTEAGIYLKAFSEINPQLGALDSSLHDSEEARKDLIKGIIAKAYPDE